MSIDLEDARKAASLARIKVSEEELPKIATELSSILVFMESLNEVDIENVEPMTSVTPMQLKQRDDQVRLNSSRERLMVNAPDAREGFFSVPKVVE